MKTLTIAVFVAAMLAVTTPATAQLGASSDPAARQSLDAFARCIVERKPQESVRVLNQDFRSGEYKNALKLLSQDPDGKCANVANVGGDTMRSDNLLFAGAVAENLIERGEQPVNVQLARAAAVSTETFSPTDALAQCLARSLPDQVGSLFSAVPGSDAEVGAAEPLFSAVMPCSRAASLDQRVELSLPAMRAILATAALRLITTSESVNA